MNPHFNNPTLKTFVVLFMSYIMTYLLTNYITYPDRPEIKQETKKIIKSPVKIIKSLAAPFSGYTVDRLDKDETNEEIPNNILNR